MAGVLSLCLYVLFFCLFLSWFLAIGLIWFFDVEDLIAWVVGNAQ